MHLQTLVMLRRITLPNTVYEIGEYAFKNCAGLKSVEIPNSLELGIISEGMFYGCTSLETIKLPDNIQKIENLAFQIVKALVPLQCRKR